MAALLVALAVMAIVMTAAMPAWRQMVRREQEAELVFRGEQYARAISLFQRRAGPGALPASIDVLVEQRVLRRAYTDPITHQDFDLLRATTTTNGNGSGGLATTSQPGVASSQTGGIIGVTSKSKDASILIYKGATHYNEWQFVFTPQVQAPAAGPQGSAGANSGRGGRGQNPGGPRGAPAQRGRGGRGGPNGRFGQGRGFGQGGRGGGVIPAPPDGAPNTPLNRFGAGRGQAAPPPD
jgi:type II secretory pathway pseudopilin PulG